MIKFGGIWWYDINRGRKELVISMNEEKTVLTIVSYDLDSVCTSEEKKAVRRVLDEWRAVPVCKSVWLIKSIGSITNGLWIDMTDAAPSFDDSIKNRFFFAEIQGHVNYGSVICGDERLNKYLKDVPGIVDEFC